MPQTLLDILVQRYPLAKRTTLRRMLQERRIDVNGRLAKSMKQPIGESDKVVVRDARPVREEVEEEGPDAPLDIVFEDEDVLVVNKPAGLLTSTVPGERRPTLLAQVRQHIFAQSRTALVGLIHRLDRDASGLLVFSKNNGAYQDLKDQLFRRTMGRVYMAVVDGTPKPASGRIEMKLVEWADGKVRPTTRGDSGEHASTDYETVATGGGRALLRVTLETGRKHQIRVHMAEKGYPIVGDPLYNPRKGGELMLCAAELSFRHPRTGEVKRFQVAPPAQFAALVAPAKPG
jgi:23S rRNA pseudouridine1911/1915/1917 synthase